ncbi:MAG: AAA family ATPase, partial [Myxococcales bacterium]
VALLRHLLGMAAPGAEDVVLDFFAGSGSTAQAVLELNRADGGARRFVCVQSAEPVRRRSAAAQAGFGTIADIARARIGRVLGRGEHVRFLRAVEAPARRQAEGHAAPVPGEQVSGVELVIFVGLQGAGKSSLYQACYAATHVLVSKDLLRNNPRPERRQRVLIEEHLARGSSVVVDNTNPRLEDRAPLIELGRRFGARVVAVHVRSTVRESLERNARRDGRARVPDVAIFSAAKRMVPPTAAEGFDAVYFARLSKGVWEVLRAEDAVPPAKR